MIVMTIAVTMIPRSKLPGIGLRREAEFEFLARELIVAIFYPFGQFCEINIPLPSLQKQPNTAPNLFQRGVEYGKYVARELLTCQRPRNGQAKTV